MNILRLIRFAFIGILGGLILYIILEKITDYIQEKLLISDDTKIIIKLSIIIILCVIGEIL